MEWLDKVFSNDIYNFLSDKIDQLGQTLSSSALASQQEARDYTAMREDTAVQRRVADMEAAGLNPWLAVQNGNLTAASSSAAQAATSSGEGSLAGVASSVSVINAMTSALKAMYQGANGLVSGALKAAS